MNSDDRDRDDGAAALTAWARICADPSARESPWISGEDAPTLAPFDTFDIVRGVPAIVQHLARRDQVYGIAEIVADPVACWSEDGGIIVVAEANLRHSPLVGGAEMRRMVLVIAAATGETLRIRHVTEAVPAVLPLVIESYRRPPRRLETP